jgi:hypothetical protein
MAVQERVVRVRPLCYCAQDTLTEVRHGEQGRATGMSWNRYTVGSGSLTWPMPAYSDEKPEQAGDEEERCASVTFFIP